MGFNQRSIDRDRKAARRAAEQLVAVGDGHARAVVAIWNSRLKRGARPSFYPTLETAIASGMPVLEFMCPACLVVGEVDIRTLDRHRSMTISGLIPSLSCKRCCPNPPFALLRKLHR